MDNGFYQFTIYHIIKNYANTDSIKARIITSDNLVYDTTTNQVAVINDPGFIDIHTTIHNLIKIADDTEDPIYPGVLQTYNPADTLPAKLFIAAMLDLSLAHNSPQEKEQEIANGIFSSYMQFMDNIVRNWSSIGSAEKGFIRLDSIHNRILDVNKGTIIDPVLVDFRGVTFEYKQDVQGRKNIVFYMGLTRLDCEVDKPDYLPGEKCGVGIQFRISANVELCSFNPSDSNSVLPETFISGESNRRIIVKPTNDIVDQFYDRGVWVGALLPPTDEKQYYIDITPVRLPIASPTSNIKIDTAFYLGADPSYEKNYNTDIQGALVDGVAEDFIRIFELDSSGEIIDTLKNLKLAEIFIGNNRKRIEINDHFFNGINGTQSEFEIVDSGVKLRGDEFEIESKEGNGAVIVVNINDSSSEVSDFTVVCNINLIPSSVRGIQGEKRSLIFRFNFWY